MRFVLRSGVAKRADPLVGVSVQSVGFRIAQNECLVLRDVLVVALAKAGVIVLPVLVSTDEFLNVRLFQQLMDNRRWPGPRDDREGC